ncbi:MAG: hypothetical protein ACX98W_13845 [bacterium]
MSLPESLERAASELPDLADRIRPANGDPHRLLEELETAQASSLLAWILRFEPEIAEELITAWGESETGAAILLRQSEDGLPKASRKQLRRAHHRLRSQGVEIESAAADSPEPVRRVVGSEDRWQAAYVSAPDFRGARIGYLVDSHPAGGARLFEIRFDEERGIRDLKVYNAGRSKVRGFLRSLTAGRDQHLFEVDGTALRALIRRASLAQPVDRPLPTAFVEWRGRLFPESLEHEATPGAQARVALAEPSGLQAAEPPSGSAEPLAAVLGEVGAGRLGPWPPATTWVTEWMEKGREAVGDLEGDSRSAAIEAWLEEASAVLAEEGSPAPIARHLEEMAWLRWQSGSPESAREMIAVADALSNDGDAWHRIARARVESIFAPFLADLAEAPAKESTPGGDEGPG